MPEQLVPHAHGLCAQKCPEASKATASLQQQSRCTVQLCELRNSNCSSQLPFHNVIHILGSKHPQVLRKSQAQSAAGKSGWCTVSHHQSVAGKESSNACGRNGRWRGQEEEEQGRRPCWEGCGGRVCIRPSPRAALHTENRCGWRKGLPGEHSAWPLQGQGSSQLYFGRGGGSDALRRAVGWLVGLEEHQNDFILEICPCGALSVPWLSQPRAGGAAGTCFTHNCTLPIPYGSAGKRAGEEASQARARSCSLWHA